MRFGLRQRALVWVRILYQLRQGLGCAMTLLMAERSLQKVWEKLQPLETREDIFTVELSGASGSMSTRMVCSTSAAKSLNL